MKIINKTPDQLCYTPEFILHIENAMKEIITIFKDLGVKNPFHNSKWLEVIASLRLKQRCNVGTQGNDAIDNENNEVEHKSILGRSASFQWHWLSDSKIQKISQTSIHCFSIRNEETEMIDEIYKLETSKLLPLIKEKATNSKKISGHKSLSLQQIKDLGAKSIWKRSGELCDDKRK